MDGETEVSVDDRPLGHHPWLVSHRGCRDFVKRWERGCWGREDAEGEGEEGEEGEGSKDVGGIHCGGRIGQK